MQDTDVCEIKSVRTASYDVTALRWHKDVATTGE
jgi:hypothetical protein